MYICICNAITDREIRGAVALGASSLADLKSALGVATRCGRCEDCAKRVLCDAGHDDCRSAGGDD